MGDPERHALATSDGNQTPEPTDVACVAIARVWMGIGLLFAPGYAVVIGVARGKWAVVTVFGVVSLTLVALILIRVASGGDFDMLLRAWQLGDRTTRRLRRVCLCSVVAFAIGVIAVVTTGVSLLWVAGLAIAIGGAVVVTT